MGHKYRMVEVLLDSASSAVVANMEMIPTGTDSPEHVHAGKPSAFRMAAHGQAARFPHSAGAILTSESRTLAPTGSAGNGKSSAADRGWPAQLRQAAGLATVLGWLICPGCGKLRAAAKPVKGPRIVSTVPAATRILVQIGAANRLVGVSPYDRPALPPGERQLPVVGDFLHMDYEMLLRVRPTALVIQMVRSRIPPHLITFTERHRIRLINLHLTTLHQLYRSVVVLGTLADHAHTARQRVALLKRKLDAISRRYVAHRRRVVLIINPSPIMVVGAHNFLNRLMELAGAVNAAAPVGAGYPIIDRETLLRLAPQVLLIAAPGQPPQRGPKDPRLARWQRLPIPAVRQHCVFLVTAENFEIPSLAVDHQVRLLGRLIHQTGRSVRQTLTKGPR